MFEDIIMAISLAFTFMLKEPLEYRRVHEISPSQMVLRMLAFLGALFNSDANRKRTQGEITLNTRLAVFMLSKESSGRSVKYTSVTAALIMFMNVVFPQPPRPTANMQLQD